MKNFFPTNLKYLRTHNNDTQQSLTEKINSTIDNEKDKIHSSSIGRWENEDREPSVLNALRVAEAYNISIADLVSKDLRIKDSERNKSMVRELFKKALVEKGYMKADEDLAEENYEKLLEMYKFISK